MHGLGGSTPPPRLLCSKKGAASAGTWEGWERGGLSDMNPPLLGTRHFMGKCTGPRVADQVSRTVGAPGKATAVSKVQGRLG